jgi:hypothetical protein
MGKYGMSLPKVYIPKGVKIVNQKSPMTVRQRKFAKGQVNMANKYMTFDKIKRK